jgi:hypothetical protein
VERDDAQLDATRIEGQAKVVHAPTMETERLVALFLGTVVTSMSSPIKKTGHAVQSAPGDETVICQTLLTRSLH